MQVSAIFFGLLVVFSSAAFGQNDAAAPNGNWKYLGGYTFVHIDQSQRAFQCRIDRDMNVYFSVAKVTDGQVEWSPTRYFSIYGQEIDLSGPSWGKGSIEHRGRILLLNSLTPTGDSNERLELDPVATLPTICEHYLQISYE